MVKYNSTITYFYLLLSLFGCLRWGLMYLRITSNLLSRSIWFEFLILLTTHSPDCWNYKGAMARANLILSNYLNCLFHHWNLVCHLQSIFCLYNWKNTSFGRKERSKSGMVFFLIRPSYLSQQTNQYLLEE